jgi:predicted RNase H-like nuclease
MNTFIGVDLGWYGKPTGLASVSLDGSDLHLRSVARLDSVDEILRWIHAESGSGSAIAAVDAPLVIRNRTSIRQAERELNADFRRFHAGCHAANLGRPFAEKVISFSRRLEALGFGHGASITPRQEGRFQIEVHPHAATVRLFGLDRIVKYKRGTREQRGRELRRLRSLAMAHLPALSPSLSARFPSVPKTGNLKPTEDKIDAILCAYIAAHWWVWATKRNRLYGNQESGYIVVPTPRQPKARRIARRPSVGSAEGHELDLDAT